MRIESVTAHAFGPLAGQTLELAPGMTVVTGLNESGKSSWHAAFYSALCGRRRGPGAGLAADRAFAERHRPWSGQGWRVSAIVALDDGRRIELTHDLFGQVDCRATDLALGNDVSGEIMFEGSPDGSRWLGLDRRSFLS
ncbi:MAG: AAA family ATPase, partial [Actinomycetes bacterium]